MEVCITITDRHALSIYLSHMPSMGSWTISNTTYLFRY